MDKIQRLRLDAAMHRKHTEKAQLLQLQMGESRIWTSLLASFLHCHEKHATFTMMQLKALDQHDAAPLLHLDSTLNISIGSYIAYCRIIS